MGALLRSFFATFSRSLSTFTSNMGILFVGIGCSSFLAFLYSFYAARALGPEQYSDFVSAVTITSVLFLAIGPINGIVTQLSAHYSSHNEEGSIVALNRKLLFLFVKVGTPLLLVVLIITPALANVLNFLSWVPLGIAFLMSFLHLFMSVSRGTLRGMQKFKGLSVNMVFESFMRLFIGIVLLFFFQNAGWAITAYLIAYGLALYLSFSQIKLSWTTTAEGELDTRALKKFSVFFFLFLISSGIMQNLDQLAAKYFLTSEESGIYGAAFNLSRVITIISQPVLIILLPLITSSHSRGETVRKHLVLCMGLMVGLSSVPIILFYLAPSFIIHAIYGANYIGSAEILGNIGMVRAFSILCHALALCCIAIKLYQGLWIFLPTLFIQILLISLFHATWTGIINVMLCTLVGAFLMSVALFAFAYDKIEKNGDPWSTNAPSTL